MKTTFKPTRGHNYHVVHETKTGSARKNCYTICGEYFESGERATHRPTCPNCVKLDNPLLLPSEDRQFLKTVVEMGIWRDAPKSKSFHNLVACDYINNNNRITRRGLVLADDWKTGPVPMQDVAGLVHAREPLGALPRCDTRIAAPLNANNQSYTLEGVADMTVSRYEKLRKLEDSLVISCISCLGK